MSAVVTVHSTDPLTCDVVAAVSGGQFVETRAPSGTAQQYPVGPAGAGSVTAVGVAIIDATNAAQATNLAYPLPPATTVATKGVVAGVTYAANTTYGARLKCAANGQVTPWVSGTDNPAIVVGYCAEPAGVSSAATGRVRLVNLS